MEPAPDKETEILERYCAGYSLRQLPKGRPLLYQGEIPPSVFFIKKGVVKMYNITADGDEKIVSYESRGALLPLEWLFDRSPVSSYYYDSFSDCQVYAVPKRDLLQIIASHRSAANALLNRFVAAYIGANIHVHALEQSKARYKLLYIFQYLVLRFGEPTDSSHYRINLRLTHQDIANLIGSTRETASSEISKLTKEGVISIKELRYIIDTDKALRLLGETEFAELKL